MRNYLSVFGSAPTGLQKKQNRCEQETIKRTRVETTQQRVTHYLRYQGRLPDYPKPKHLSWPWERRWKHRWTISISALSKTRYRLKFSWGSFLDHKKTKWKWNENRKKVWLSFSAYKRKKIQIWIFPFCIVNFFMHILQGRLKSRLLFFFYLVLRSLILLGPLVGVFCHCDRGCWCQHLNEQQKYRCDIALSSKHSALNNDHEMSHHPISLTITLWREIRTIKVIKRPLSSAP